MVWAASRRGKMAIGAVFLSLPMAAFFAVYSCAFHGTPAAYAILVYALAGALILSSYTLLNGVFPEEPR
jgi:ABC-type spermidine/putrescine transport system permease subunit II